MVDLDTNLLMIPGPVPVHPRVFRAMSKPIFGHRTEEYRKLLKETVDKLKTIMKIKIQDVFIFAGSGTLSLHAAMANLVEPGDKVLNCINGKFSERTGEIAEKFGGDMIPLTCDWGQPILPEDIKEALNADPEIKIVTLCHNETSTGILNPLKEIGAVAKDHGALMVADGITSVGGDEAYPELMNTDMMISGSQKCLGIPPGLAVLTVGPDAWDKIKKRTTPIRDYYTNLLTQKKKWDRDQDTPWTSATTLVQGLHESLTIMLVEGYENRVARHRLLAKALREGIKAIGLELFANEKYASNTVTAIRYPNGIQDHEFRKRMHEKWGVTIALAQAPYKGKFFRIATMNICLPKDILTTLAVVELVLKEMGYEVKLGAGVGAAQKVFLEN